MFLSLTSDVQYIQDAINHALTLNIKTAVLTKVRFVFLFALFIFLFKEFFLLLVSGGNERIEPKKHIITPLFYMTVFMLWIPILNIIVTMSKSLGDVLINDSLNADYIQKMDKFMTKSLIAISKQNFTLGLLTGSSYRNLMAIFTINILKNVGLFLDSFFVQMFAAYSQIMVVILKIVSPIALVLSFLPGLKSVFISWLKSFISVNLWFGVGSLIFQLINALSVSYLEHNLEKLELNDGFSFGIKIGFAFVGLGIFKGIMMFKVPQIVSMIIGNNSSGGMFGAAFAPMMVAVGAAKAGVSVGKAAVGGK